MDSCLLQQTLPSLPFYCETCGRTSWSKCECFNSSNKWNTRTKHCLCMWYCSCTDYSSTNSFGSIERKEGLRNVGSSDIFVTCNVCSHKRPSGVQWCPECERAANEIFSKESMYRPSNVVSTEHSIVSIQSQTSISVKHPNDASVLRIGMFDGDTPA